MGHKHTTHTQQHTEKVASDGGGAVDFAQRVHFFFSPQFQALFHRVSNANM